MIGRLLSFAVAGLILGHPGASLAAEKKAPRPDWCRPGWVCLPSTEAAEMTVLLADLEADLAAARVKRQKAIGWAAVCGPAASLSVQDGETTFAGTVSCTLGFGFRF